MAGGALFSQIDQQPVWIGNVKLHPLYWTIVALFYVVHNLYVQIRSQTRRRHRSDIKKISDLWLAQVGYLTDNAWLGVHYEEETSPCQVEEDDQTNILQGKLRLQY